MSDWWVLFSRRLSFTPQVDYLVRPENLFNLNAWQEIAEVTNKELLIQQDAYFENINIKVGKEMKYTLRNDENSEELRYYEVTLEFDVGSEVVFGWGSNQAAEMYSCYVRQDEMVQTVEFECADDESKQFVSDIDADRFTDRDEGEDTKVFTDTFGYSVGYACSTDDEDLVSDRFYNKIWQSHYQYQYFD